MSSTTTRTPVSSAVYTRNWRNRLGFLLVQDLCILFPAWIQEVLTGSRHSVQWQALIFQQQVCTEWKKFHELWPISMYFSLHLPWFGTSWPINLAFILAQLRYREGVLLYPFTRPKSHFELSIPWLLGILLELEIFPFVLLLQFRKQATHPNLVFSTLAKPAVFVERDFLFPLLLKLIRVIQLWLRLFPNSWVKHILSLFHERYVNRDVNHYLKIHLLFFPVHI